MVHRCCVCKWHGNKKPRRSFHTFPKDINRKRQWLQILGRKWATPRTVVCSAHFKEECFEDALVCGRIRLKKESVPFLSLPGNAGGQSKNKKPPCESSAQLTHAEKQQCESSVQLSHSEKQQYELITQLLHGEKLCESSTQLSHSEKQLCESSITVLNGEEKQCRLPSNSEEQQCGLATKVSTDERQQCGSCPQISNDEDTQPRLFIKILDDEDQCGSFSKISEGETQQYGSSLCESSIGVQINSMNIATTERLAETMEVHEVKETEELKKPEINQLNRSIQPKQSFPVRKEINVKKKIALMRRHVRRLRQSKEQLKSRIKELETELEERDARIELMNSKLGPIPKALISQLTSTQKNVPFFPLPLKVFASTVSFLSEKTYRYMRKVFPSLPHISTVRRWHDHINVNPTICEATVDSYAVADANCNTVLLDHDYACSGEFHDNNHRKYYMVA